MPDEASSHPLPTMPTKAINIFGLTKGDEYPKGSAGKMHDHMVDLHSQKKRKKKRPNCKKKW